MRFQTKLLLTYTLLIFLLVVGLGIGFVFYSARVFEENARSNYTILADRIIDQFENRIRSMDFFETNLVSDLRLKSALDTLGSLDRADPLNGIDLSDAALTVRASVVTYSAIKYFYAVNLYNARGDFFSSNFLDHAGRVDVPEVLSDLPWVATVDGLSGKSLLVPPHPDPWNQDRPRRVFSLVRHMPGSRGDLGYIEVQDEAQVLDRLFQVPDPAFARVAAWTASGDLFYASQPLTASEVRVYRDEAGPPTASFAPTPLTGRQELILRRRSADTGLVLTVALDRAVVGQPLGVTVALTVLVGLSILGLSITYNWYSSRQLTQPLRLIQRRMEGTGLSNLPHMAPLDHPNDEIVALNGAFDGLKERLDQAIRDEIRTRTLGVQAQLDSLQAQVNPHFLYNILTVLAAKGLEVGAAEIGEICAGIAGMLRYSTSTADRTATLDDEIRHVETYLGLMKKRFEDRLTYTIDVDPGLRAATLPKIVLQQVVENSVNHGFRSVSRPMVLGLTGRQQADRWVLEFTDNGQGFAPEELERQTAALAETSRRLDGGLWNEGLNLGGLGLRNTYGRLHLFFSGRVGWEMANRPEGGALVRISAPILAPSRGEEETDG